MMRYANKTGAGQGKSSRPPPYLLAANLTSCLSAVSRWPWGIADCICWLRAGALLLELAAEQVSAKAGASASPNRS